MNEWPLKPLSEVCEINPRLPRGHGIADDHGVAFVPMAAVDEVSGTIAKRHVRAFSEVKKGFTFFQDRDVLFAKITPCMENGKAALAENLAGGLGFGSTEFHVLRAKDVVLPEWLFYFVRQPSFRSEAKRNFTGTGGQQRVPTNFLASTLIPVPPLSEQKRMTDLLSRAEGIVRLRREAQRKAAELVPAIFTDLFGDPATNPKGLAFQPLGNLLASSPGNGLYKHKSAYGSGVPILRIDAFYAGEIRNLAMLKRVAIDADELRRFGLTENDIVINRVNSPEYLGKSALIPPLAEPTVFESNMMRLSLNTTLVQPGFMIAFLQTRFAKEHFLAHAKHAINQSSINQQDVKALPVMLPPQHLQARFMQQAKAVRSIQARQEAALARANATFQALLAKAFSH